jgi:hypothetical protein
MLVQTLGVYSKLIPLQSNSIQFLQMKVKGFGNKNADGQLSPWWAIQIVETPLEFFNEQICKCNKSKEPDKFV